MDRPIRPAIMRLCDLAVSGVVVVFLLPVWFLPRRLAVRVGGWYGRVVWLCWGAGRRAGMINLRRAYGRAMDRAAAWRVTGRVFENLGRSLAEGAQFARRFGRGQAGWDAECEAEHPEIERRILSDPRPKIFVAGHLGSWEIGLMMAGLRVGPRGAAIMRRVDNPFLDRLVTAVRFTHASQRIEKRGGAVEALARLRAGDSVAMLLDENAGYRGVFVDFFGRPASTHKSAALLSLMTGAPVVVSAAVRRERGLLYRLEVLEPGETTVADLTQRIVRVYERWIREDPEQWRWVHWRWKTRPDGSEETYRRRDLRRCFQDSRPAADRKAEVPAG